mmetsp:Transcript_36250/g.96337  ORF Transcript_36250/g.96337 Transcript_36250/m.96337 type:complete len:198 (-) Transcript_36250:66-659(-)
MLQALSWRPWRCWVCQDLVDVNWEVDGQLESATDVPSHLVQRSKTKPLAQPATSGVSRTETERTRLRQLMQTFVERGMAGVSCELVANDGSRRRGVYSIDEQLSRVTFESPNTTDQVIQFTDVSSVCRAEDHDLSPPMFGALCVEERNRLLKIVYTDSLKRVVFFLEATNSDAQRFMTCVRILRRYTEDLDNGRQGL